jgi:uncharacterized protein
VTYSGCHFERFKFIIIGKLLSVEALKMGAKEYGVGRVFLIRADYGSDLLQFILASAKRHEIAMATFTAVGALKSAKLGFYDQQKHEYHAHVIEEPVEIASCGGNISIKDSEPFIHAHVVLSTSDGSAKGGHLMESKVFAAEIHLFELFGKKAERKKDDVTGLHLWDI